MKAQNLNNSSFKTRKLIRKTFAEMLSEKKEMSKISVSELAKRADINRGTFYSHYDDIYAVAEDYENELLAKFFDNATLLSPLLPFTMGWKNRPFYTGTGYRLRSVWQAIIRSQMPCLPCRQQKFCSRRDSGSQTGRS